MYFRHGLPQPNAPCHVPGIGLPHEAGETLIQQPVSIIWRALNSGQKSVTFVWCIFLLDMTSRKLALLQDFILIAAAVTSPYGMDLGLANFSNHRMYLHITLSDMPYPGFNLLRIKRNLSPKMPLPRFFVD